MRQKVIGLVVIVLVLGGLSGFIYALTNNKVSIGYNDGYKPEQPIPFSHKLHAGEYKIDCQYCHANASVSRHATVPSLNICMNCHLTVKPSSPHIKKVRKAYQNNKSIAWEKVHLLPDFVKFDHSAHIQAGKKCEQCHGPVEKMSVMYQWSSLSMGECISCHRKKQNDAPTTCVTCHY